MESYKFIAKQRENKESLQRLLRVIVKQKMPHMGRLFKGV